MVTTGVGRQAETAVADFLVARGYKILDRNWRTRWCEIDLVAQKDEAVYFVEVKYRGSRAQGGGFEYIGPQKLRQLKFAADFWAAANKWEGDCQVIGAEVSGLSFEQIELVEIY